MRHILFYEDAGRAMPENPPIKSETSADLGGLTSIWFFAALVVVLFHMFFDEGNPVNFWTQVIADGHLGVDLFFILSGFILTHVYAPEWRSGRFCHREFLWKRFARIYPLHVFMIFAFIVAYGIAASVGFGGSLVGQDWALLPWHVLLLHAWGFVDHHAWNFPSWSVSAEAFAYLTFPLFLMIYLRFRPFVSLVVSIAVFIGVSVVFYSRGYVITKMMYDFGIVRIAVEFGIGVALYQVFKTVVFPEGFTGPVLAGTLCVIVFLSASQADERLVVLCLAVLIWCVACRSQSGRAGILNHPFFVYLGEISYATYMVHLLVIMSVDAISAKLGLAEWLRISATFLIVYAASIILYHWIEVPSRRYLRRRVRVHAA